MSHSQRVRIERRALQSSIFGSLFFVLLAFGFAVWTGSNAILFDGIYSLIGLSTALLTLKVARLAELPGDDRFHFGYTTIEPTINLFKALIVSVSCVVAAIQAARRLLDGGNPAEYGLAVFYGGIATLGCAIAAWVLHRSSHKSRSDLVRMEARTWLLDAVLSASVLLGFAGAWFLEQSALAQYAPLVDPTLLIVLVLAALPIPIQIMLQSLREVVAMAPPKAVVDEIERRIVDSLQGVDYDHVEFRVSKQGRNTYLLVHVVVPRDYRIRSIADLDRIRRHSEKLLQDWNPEIVMDMLFVEDRRLTE